MESEQLNRRRDELIQLFRQMEEAVQRYTYHRLDKNNISQIKTEIETWLYRLYQLRFIHLEATDLPLRVDHWVNVDVVDNNVNITATEKFLNQLRRQPLYPGEETDESRTTPTV